MRLSTFIRWQGNKSRYIKHIIKKIPKQVFDENYKGTYIEPFLGSGALFLYMKPEKWIINDLNKDNINIWKNVKDNPKKIIQKFKNFSNIFKKKNREEKIIYCKKNTKKIEEMDYDIKRASLYLLMKFCSYMGNIFIKNKFMFAGLELNISINNNYTFLKKKYYDLLLNVSDFMNDTKGKIYNSDYKIVLKKAKKGDFVFLDPPYMEDHSYQFNYNKEEKIDEKFYNELKAELKKLDKKGVKWVMTQANTTIIKKIFKDFDYIKYSVFRRSSLKKSFELLYYSK